MRVLRRCAPSYFGLWLPYENNRNPNDSLIYAPLNGIMRHQIILFCEHKNRYMRFCVHRRVQSQRYLFPISKPSLWREAISSSVFIAKLGILFTPNKLRCNRSICKNSCTMLSLSGHVCFSIPIWEHHKKGAIALLILPVSPACCLLWHFLKGANFGNPADLDKSICLCFSSSQTSPFVIPLYSGAVWITLYALSGEVPSRRLYGDLRRPRK